MRQEILDAASRLINRGGVEELTMRTLGKEVGVTAATLYGYFPSKEAVLDALLEEKTQVMNKALTYAASGFEPGVRRLCAFAVGYRHFATRSPDFYGMFIIKFEPPDWAGIANGTDKKAVVLTTLHHEIQVAMDAGDMYPMSPEAVCRMLWSVAHGYVTLERGDCFDTARLSPEDQIRRYLEHILLSAKGLIIPDHYEDLLSRIDDYVHISGDIQPGGDEV